MSSRVDHTLATVVRALCGRLTRVRCSIEAHVQHATYHSDRYAAGFVIKVRIVLPGAARQHAKSLEISRSSVVGARGPSLALQSLAVFSNPI